MPIQLTARLPAVVTADDYHEFDAHQDILRTVLGGQVKVKEITGEFDTGPYVAVIYHNKLPDSKTIRCLLKANNIPHQG